VPLVEPYQTWYPTTFSLELAFHRSVTLKVPKEASGVAAPASARIIAKPTMQSIRIPPVQ
jgi:hypothetical protein